MTPDRDSVERIIRETSAQIILPRFRNLADGDIREKDGGSIVTAADLEAETRLSSELVTLVPGSRVVGEEGADADPGVLSALDGEPPVWIIDPLDGTQNFAEGKPCFAVIIA